MGMYKSLLLFNAFLILHVLASPIIDNSTRTPTKMIPTQRNTTGNMTTKTKQENPSNHTASTSTTASSKNSTIQHSSNGINSVTEQNLTVPTAQVSTVKITTSTTKTSRLTNSPGLTDANVIISRTSSLTDATEHNRNENLSNSTSTYLITGSSLNKTSNETLGAGLTHSEKSLTIVFSVVLGVLVLLVLGQIVYRVTKNKHRRIQYSHHPLFNENSAEQFMVPDGPQIYNSTVTAMNDDQQTFAYTPTQFRLELLHEDQETEQTYKASTFITFNNTEREPQ